MSRDKVIPNKKLGQHWLHDRASLQAMCDAADVAPGDTVLEIGPGLGTLTALLVKHADRVVAVEFDPRLAAELDRRVTSDKLTVHHQDILSFDLSSLPPDFKVVANVPYYITSKIVRMLLEAHNRPVRIALLVQKEVAQRIAAAPGEMSMLSVAAQLYADVRLGPEVPARLFMPPPEVDSQVISLVPLQVARFPDIDPKDLFRVAKAGFAERRKKLRSSLAGGLRLDKPAVDALLESSGIPAEARAQELSLEQWAALTRQFLATMSS